MNLRKELATTLTQTTYSHLADALKERAMEAHERELNEWSLGLNGVCEAEDVQA
jgi:hypothetical protein